MYGSARSAARCVALLAAVGLGPSVGGSEIRAIYTNIPGHPTAQVPGVPGEQFRSPLAPFMALYGSPIGDHWIFKAFTDNPDSGANDVIVVGSAATGTVVAKEGNPAPIPDLTYGFMDSDCGINDSAWYVFGNRLSGGSSSNDEVIFKFDGVSIVPAAREGDSAPGLIDPDGAGNELFGNTLNSAHVLNDGTAAFHADQIQNINSDYRSALYHGSAPVAQEGTNIGTASGVDVYDDFVALGGSTFTSSANGGSWIVEADVLPGTGTEEAVVVNGSIVIRDGDILAPDLLSPVDGIFEVDMGGGHWFARGDLADDRAWVVRDGEVIAATGRPVVAGGTELFTSPILAINGSGSGDYIVIGTTSYPDPNANQVAVLSGQRVIARSGDPVILGGAGPGVEAFVESFDAFDAFIRDDLNDDLVDDRELYVFAGLRDRSGATLGDAFLRVRIHCPWDCGGDHDGAVGIVDFLALLAQWGEAGGTCDFDGGGVGVVDFLALLGNWGPCPG
jgi:hypothetical protein